MTSESLNYNATRSLEWGTLHHNWGWMLALGIVWVIIGALAIILLFAATLATTLTLGVLFGIGGVVQIVQAFSCRGWRGFGLHLAGGAIALILGALLLVFPLEGVFTLTIFLSAYFIVQGALKIISAFQSRPLRNWGWMLASGVLGIGIGLLIWIGLPGSAAWALGLLVGIELIFTGFAMVMLALSARTPQAT